MVSAKACANIALVKYWGKADTQLNLPAAGSISVTLDRLETRTEISFDDALTEDVLLIEEQEVGGRALARVQTFLDLVRSRAAPQFANRRARVETINDFPTAAGLASSASGFAALAAAADRAYELDLTQAERSALARRGSGSAARSICGGFARMHAGSDDGSSYAVEIDSKLELAAAIAVTDFGAKAVGSTDGMEHTRRTSPYHSAWLGQVKADLSEAEAAIQSQDIEHLAQITEGSCLAMHANAMAARPGLLYFEPATLWAIERVRTLRAAGLPIFFTVDAGPHVVAFTTPEHLEDVALALAEHDQIRAVLVSGMGPAASVTKP